MSIIKGFLKLIEKESNPIELTNIPPQQTQKYLDHFAEDELLKVLIISDILVSHNANVKSDQVEGIKDVVINEFLEMIGDEGYFFSGSVNTQMTLNGNVIDDIFQEESKCAFSSDQILNHVEIGTIEMALDTVA